MSVIHCHFPHLQLSEVINLMRILVQTLGLFNRIYQTLILLQLCQFSMSQLPYLLLVYVLFLVQFLYPQIQMNQMDLSIQDQSLYHNNHIIWLRGQRMVFLNQKSILLILMLKNLILSRKQSLIPNGNKQWMKNLEL